MTASRFQTLMRGFREPGEMRLWTPGVRALRGRISRRLIAITGVSYDEMVAVGRVERLAGRDGGP